MKKYRWIFFLLFLGVNMVLGVIFAPFVVAKLLTPLALAFWVFLRLTVLHIDQKDYWFLFVCTGVILAFYRLNRTLKSAEAEEPVEVPESNVVLNETKIWFTSFLFAETSDLDRRTIQRDLASLLVSFYTSRKPDSTPYDTLQALEQRQIPLPEPIYQFLFPEITKASRSPLQRALRFIQNAPRKWVRKWTGRDKAELRQSIEEVLSFMENALEITNGDEYFNLSKH